jgi:carboxyl-terminal processing protease
VKDYSAMSYSEAFDALFKKASVEYPFTKEKGINWEALYQQSKPNFDKASSSQDFYIALRDFAYQIPDGHVNVTLDRDVFYANYGGGFGLVLALLSDQTIIVSEVLPGKPGDSAGIQPGAQIISWDGMPVMEAVKKVVSGFGPYSAEHTRLLGQVVFLTRVPPNSKVEVTFKNPDSQEKTVTMQAEAEYDSLFKTIPSFSQDVLELPITGKVLSSGIGYIRITSFNDDYNLMAKLWDRYMQSMVDNDVAGLIIDLRSNSGGSSGLAMDFAGYFFDRESQPHSITRVRSRCWSVRIALAPAKALPMRYIKISALSWWEIILPLALLARWDWANISCQMISRCNYPPVDL